MKTISQRELRNDNAEVMRGVEQGETYTVTRRGVPIATVSPITETSDLRCLRPARRRPVYSQQERVRGSAPTKAILDDLRGER
ncbi:type II toxin-antitoxin system prevent-host-death family antitoxin [Sinomonas albida]|uniref:type II toxin-antitoxin system Phd/YefM family antitoxin n=1 Tax=Sinomonas albida TaxID=369942 RepID=UPI00301ABE3C